MIKETNTKIKGQDIGPTGTCRHYHQEVDVVGLLCSNCQQYYACFQCHDELEKHSFEPSSVSEGHPVPCGVCHSLLTYDEYQEGACVNCQSPFNPKCSLHKDYYFCS
ncbi:CHY zinc finger protein [Fructobacillus sp. W13]|uniref:CHY zinc finger protein n=1 Tax=Fructobacillus apis TaxID=2935017 RepID=A0ABT0ZPZ2_9LACO|nr:CHY zinc finger protein [Fructobacillus apis]MCO0832060.1 CHY zinc finger protein [Fructobacillus apis]